VNAFTLACVLLIGLSIFSLGASFDHRRECSREEDFE